MLLLLFLFNWVDLRTVDRLTGFLWFFSFFIFPSLQCLTAFDWAAVHDHSKNLNTFQKAVFLRNPIWERIPVFAVLCCSIKGCVVDRFKTFESYLRRLLLHDAWNSAFAWHYQPRQLRVLRYTSVLITKISSRVGSLKIKPSFVNTS